MNTVKTCINETNEKYGQGLTCPKYAGQITDILETDAT